jgi:imidazolonepropionase-like amidohydrolase
MKTMNKEISFHPVSGKLMPAGQHNLPKPFLPTGPRVYDLQQHTSSVPLSTQPNAAILFAHCCGSQTRGPHRGESQTPFGQRLFLHGLAILFFLSINILFVSIGFAETLLLQNGIIHTISGETITNGQVMIAGDKIQSVGIATDQPPKADKIINLNGQHVYPGMIALNSAVGLSEIEAIRATQDNTEVGEFTSDVQSWIAVNPDSEIIPVTRVNGITHIEPAPKGGVVAGLSGLLQLSGWTIEQMEVKQPVALHVYWPGMGLDTTPKEKFKDPKKFKSLDDQAHEREEKLKSLAEFFLNARAYAAGRDALAKSGGADPGVNPPWEAMLPVVRGQIPIMVHADDLRQIKAALRWAKTNDYKIVIVGGADACRVGDELATQKVPVILESVFDQPAHDQDAYDVNFKAAEVLHHAGVKVAFGMGSASFNAPMAKNLPYLAAQAVAFGLPEDEALKGLTLYPAQILRVADRLGSIEPGKEATLFVCDGSILDLRANVKHLWIAGQEISLETRHTRLYEKYKNRPLPK